MNFKHIFVSFILIIMISTIPLFSIDKDYFVHDIGMFNNRVTNYGSLGDPAYSRNDSICIWPKYSGHSYLYDANLYFTAYVGSSRKTVTSKEDGFTPLDKIHVYKPGTKAFQETYTKYYEPTLGLIILENTYAWAHASADDFLINEYVIINDPAKHRDLFDMTFSLRLDGDIAIIRGEAPDGPDIGIDDHAMCNSNNSFTINDAVESQYNGTYNGWEWVKLLPYMNRQIQKSPQLLDTLNTFPLDSCLTFMWDGDNPKKTAIDLGLDTSLVDETYDLDHLEDDTGNPDINGRLKAPGFIGWRMLKSTPKIQPKSYATISIHDSPLNYEGLNTFFTFKDFLSSHYYAQWESGEINPHDYGTITTYGPLDTLRSGDTLTVTIAYGVGANEDKGGIYSLIELNRIMQTAQNIVDSDYSLDFKSRIDVYEINLDIHDETFSKDIKFGWSPEATQYFDEGLDEYAGNEAAPNTFDARFINNNDQLIKDIRSNATDIKMSWNIDFQASAGNGPINIEWDSNALPDTGNFILHDTLDANKIYINMRNTNRYRSKSGDPTYLRITYQPATVKIKDANIPQNFSIGQNHPNPFNPITTITYQIVTNNKVDLSIYDMSGRKITTLVNDYLNAGKYETTWNASEFGSGIYIARLMCGNVSKSTKMVLMK